MRTVLPALILLAACGGESKDDTGNQLNMPYCEDTPTVVSLDEETALGFAPQALLDLAVATWEEDFTWARDDSTSALTLGVVHSGGEARFVDSEAVYPDGGGAQPAIAVICDDRVEIDVEVSLSTDDGAFDETWTGPLVGYAAERAELRQDLDPDALGGSYDMDLDISEPDYDERSLWANAAFDAAGSSGTIAGQVSGTGDCTGDTCTAWAASISVGSWGATE